MGAPATRAYRPKAPAALQWLWAMPTIPEPRDTARVRLICYPFAAGRPEIFDSWSRHMPHDVEIIISVRRVESHRRSERPHSSVDEIVEELAQEIQPLLDRPFALFGHDLGAITMFELARRLKAACGVVPVTLFVSAAVAPPRTTFCLYTAIQERCLSICSACSTFPSQEIFRLMK